nr:SafA/ExsA family spore coat assembly protein [Metabacillus halosaccharovorans]
MKIHIVQKGDTLWKIAKKYGVDFEELKSMNTQLSNPDLIMPGMKIKVPSGNIAVKKEAPIQQAAPIKKEMPKAEHPFAKEKPKAVVDVEDTVPKEPVTEKPSKPFIPPVPNAQHPVYTGMDVNNYYTVNMAMMPNMANPPLPQKPANVLPEMTKEEAEVEKAEPYYLPEEKHEEDLKDMANMPNVPNMPNIPNMQMPTQTQPAMYQPQYVAPQYMVPVSPVLPGSGLCPPYYPMHPMPYGYNPAMMPPTQQQPYPTAVSPAEFDEDDDDDYDYEDHTGMPNMPYPQGVAPAHYGPGFPVNPYAGVPVSPVMPGPGFGGYPNQVLGAYGEAPDDDYENHSNMPNQPYPQAVAPAYDQGDCGCGGPAPAPYGYQMPMQQPYYGQQPMMAPQPYYGQQPMMAPQQPYYGQQPMMAPQQPYYGQQPMMAPQQFPQGQNEFNPAQQMPGAGGQMFGMPNYDREEDED